MNNRLKYILWMLLALLCFTLLAAGCSTKPANAAISHCLPGQVCPSIAYRILPLGDSITYGQDGSGAANVGGYRGPLWNDLLGQAIETVDVGSQQSGPSGPYQNNEGHPGWRIDQISASVVGWLNTYHPMVVLLHIGTNDIEQGYDVANAPARLSALIDQITSTLPKATVIVAQILHITNQPGFDSEAATYNAAIPGIVQAKDAAGKRVQMVDMYGAVPISDQPDGIHPNATGYSLMAGVWANALVPLLPKNAGIG